MATTMYFEETLRDKGGAGEPIDLEFGCSTYYGESLVHLVIEGKTLILDRTSGNQLLDAMGDLNTYLARG